MFLGANLQSLGDWQMDSINGTTLASVAAVIWRTLEAYHIAPAAVFEAVGLPPEPLPDTNARYPGSRMQQLWRKAVELSDDPCFGLRTTAFWQPTSLHALGYAWMASSTLGDALQRMERYVHMVVSGSRIRLEAADDLVAVIYEKRDGRLDYFDASLDAAMGLLISLCRQVAGEDFSPRFVDLVRREPVCRERHYALFRSPIHFGASSNRLVVDANELQRPLPGANAMLAQANERLIEDYLARFNRSQLAMLVRSKLIDLLPAGRVSEEKVADSLNISVRSLQRRLREEETSFKRILDDMRQDLARDYVVGSGYSVNEIAYLLGFSEPGNFSRAFKRWHGLPPSRYRGAHRQA